MKYFDNRRFTQDDRFRKRLTHSILFELGYTITDRFSIEGFFAWIRQERDIRQCVGEDFDHAQGVGDALLLF